MEHQHIGKASILFREPPAVLSYASVVGKKEAEGPLSETFDLTVTEGHFGQGSWEKAESQLQRTALALALDKAGFTEADLDTVYLGDLLNQCMGSSFSMRDKKIPTFGLYGACSTMAEGLILGAMSVAGGFSRTTACIASSHFASSERQFRFPLGYGGQRTPTAQWTVTGAGAVILGQGTGSLHIGSATIGTVVDGGIKDGNNMGGAMAPAAFETIRTHMVDLHRSPGDYDRIITGDLGALGHAALLRLMQKEGMDPGDKLTDCGILIYDRERQDVHCGGSGCGCSAAVLCGHLFNKLCTGEWNRILFCGTGALLSPTSVQQGETIPAICHAVEITRSP